MTSLSDAPPTSVSLPRLMVVLVPAMLLIPIAADMVSLVLPLIANQFTASTGQVAWVVTGFLLMCAIGIPIYGRVADQFSLRSLFTIALTVFAIGSLLCALAPNLLLLVTGRVVMGIGGAAIPVLVIVSAARLLPRNQTAIGFGIVGAAGGVGTAAGPAVGGGLGQLWGWPTLFWLMTGVALLLIPAIRATITDAAPQTRRRFDLLGGLILGAGVGLVLFGVTQVESAGFAAVSSWGAMLGGLVLACLFAWRTRTAADPFLPPSLFENRGYVAAVMVIFLAMVVNLATLVLVPLLVIDVNGLTPGQGSLVMIPGGLALAATSPIAGRLGARGRNEGTVTIVGLALMGLSMLFLSTLAAGAAPVYAAIAVFALGTGFALVVTPSTSAVSHLLPPDLVGVGVGIFQGAQFLGAGVGPALFATLVASRSATGSGAVNPLYSGSANAYSDAFLGLAALSVVAIMAAVGMRAAVRGQAQQGP